MGAGWPRRPVVRQRKRTRRGGATFALRGFSELHSYRRIRSARGATREGIVEAAKEPVLTYHNGPKVVGMATGNQAQRVVAHEVIDYQGTDREYKETVNRITEFGVAYHVATLVTFLQEIGVSNTVVSDQQVDVPGLVDQ